MATVPSPPLVSIICPVYNNEVGIERTLKAVTAQSYPDRCYEVLVVDNASTDNTQTVIQSFSNRNSSLVTLLEERDIQSSYAARNKGIRYANGKYLLFIDSDMTVDSDWIESIVHSMQSNDVRYMGCRVEIQLPSENPSVAAKYNCALGFPVRSYLRNRHFVPTCCLSITQDVIDEIGLFDETLKSGGDCEFGVRAHEAGIKQVYDHSIVVYHPARSSLPALIRKKIRTARGHEDLVAKYPSRFSHRSPLNPKNFLPPWPTIFWSRIQNRDSFSSVELLCFYGILYLLKLVSAFTRVHHRYASKDGDTE
ncbi:glycosyltransferase [Salinibacter sp.]|uniref:glycosyltransferase n=1 Tax=Salinibacter sp. TaxID=2065818 RepID=UPI0021E8FA68|nr:glycosyltransferase [Salinibacter sp.]